jgi:hypothetical protein
MRTTKSSICPQHDGRETGQQQHHDQTDQQFVDCGTTARR